MIYEVYRGLVVLSTSVMAAVMLFGSGAEAKPSVAFRNCVKVERTGEGTWEYVRNWHDGYNVHPYAKIRVEVGADGSLTYRRDNATGLLVFKEISEAEYEAAGCLKRM